MGRVYERTDEPTSSLATLDRSRWLPAEPYREPFPLGRPGTLASFPRLRREGKKWLTIGNRREIRVMFLLCDFEHEAPCVGEGFLPIVDFHSVLSISVVCAL